MFTHVYDLIRVFYTQTLWDIFKQNKIFNNLHILMKSVESYFIKLTNVKLGEKITITMQNKMNTLRYQCKNKQWVVFKNVIFYNN